MNIRFSSLQNREFLSDLKTIACELRLLFGLGLGILALFLIFWWDAGCLHPFAEVGPTEFSQTLLLLASTALFFSEARRCPDMRRALTLVGGLTAAGSGRPSRWPSAVWPLLSRICATP